MDEIHLELIWNAEEAWRKYGMNRIYCSLNLALRACNYDVPLSATSGWMLLRFFSIILIGTNQMDFDGMQRLWLTNMALNLELKIYQVLGIIPEYWSAPGHWSLAGKMAKEAIAENCLYPPLVRFALEEVLQISLWISNNGAWFTIRRCWEGNNRPWTDWSPYCGFPNPRWPSGW